MDSGAIANQLAAYDAKPVTSTDALNSALSQYGVPEIRQTVSGLRSTVANTANALNNVDPSVTGRTQGSLVTEAQRQKQVSNERAPIATDLTNENQALNQNQQDLTSALGEANATASAKVNDYTAGRAALQSQFNNALEREKLSASSGSSGMDPLMQALFGANGGSQTPPAATPTTAQMVQRGDNGFNFTDQNGNAINAAQYAHLTGQNFRDVLSKAAGAGDTGAKAALNFVGNDYGYDPSKITSPQLASLYQALTGKAATVYKPDTGTNYNVFTDQGAKNVRQVATPQNARKLIGGFGSGGSTVQQQLNAARAAGKVSK